MPTRERIATARAVAQEFDVLRGWMVVPAGIGMGLYGLFFSSDSGLGLTLLLATIVFGVALTKVWYDKHYGRVRANWKRDAIGAAMVLPIVAIALLALGVDHFEQLPVLVSLFSAAILLWAGIRMALRRLGMTTVDHAVPAALAVSALAPLAAGDAAPFPAVPYFFVITGIGLVVLGHAWHRRLVNLMGDSGSEYAVSRGE